MAENSGPLISIVTPNYNYARYIGETIRSVVEQDYGQVEHIIVDDGSTDHSVQVIGGFVEKYPGKVRLFIQQNSGQTAAVNACLQRVRGEIIGWINSDDTYCPGVFKQVAALFMSDPNLDIVYGDFNVIDSAGRLVYRFKKIKFNYTLASLHGFGIMLTSNSMFWRSRVMEKAGYLDQSFQFAMDCEYFSRLTRDARMKMIKIPLGNWRKHPQAKTVVYHSEKTRQCDQEIRNLMLRYYKALPLSRVIPPRLAWLPGTAVRLAVAFLKLGNGNYFIRAAGLYRYHKITRKK